MECRLVLDAKSIPNSKPSSPRIMNECSPCSYDCSVTVRRRRRWLTKYFGSCTTSPLKPHSTVKSAAGYTERRHMLASTPCVPRHGGDVMSEPRASIRKKHNWQAPDRYMKCFVQKTAREFARP